MTTGTREETFMESILHYRCCSSFSLVSIATSERVLRESLLSLCHVFTGGEAVYSPFFQQGWLEEQTQCHLPTLHQGRSRTCQTPPIANFPRRSLLPERVCLLSVVADYVSDWVKYCHLSHILQSSLVNSKDDSLISTCLTPAFISQFWTQEGQKECLLVSENSSSGCSFYRAYFKDEEREA